MRQRYVPGTTRQRAAHPHRAVPPNPRLALAHVPLPLPLASHSKQPHRAQRHAEDAGRAYRWPISGGASPLAGHVAPFLDEVASLESLPSMTSANVDGAHGPLASSDASLRALHLSQAVPSVGSTDATLTTSCQSSLRALMTVVRHLAGTTTPTTAPTSQAPQIAGVGDWEKAVLDRVEWLRIRFRAASTSALETWPLQEEIELRCLLVAARTPVDTTENLELLRHLGTHASDTASTERAATTHTLVQTAKTLTQVLQTAQNVPALERDGDDVDRNGAQPTKRHSPSHGGERELREGEPPRQLPSSLPYLLLCLSAQSSSSLARTHLPCTPEVVAQWQTNAADAFCAASSTDLLRQLAGTGSPEQRADLEPTCLFPAALTRGVLDRAWSRRVQGQLKQTLAQEAIAAVAASGDSSSHNPSAMATRAEPAVLTDPAHDVPHQRLPCAPHDDTRLHDSPYLTPFWSFCVSTMVRESWRALEVLSAPSPRQDSQTHGKRRNARGKSNNGSRQRAHDRAAAFHAIGAVLAFRRMVSSMHRHGRVLPILELHRLVTGAQVPLEAAGATVSTANTAFLHDAATYRAKLLRWSSGAGTPIRATPSSTDALLWREAVLFDAYTLITVGHTSESAVDVDDAAEATTRAAAATYVRMLQEQCVTHLQQLEAVEEAPTRGELSSPVLRHSHPLLWSLLTPRTREALRTRLREAMRLGAKFHLRLGDTDAVRNLYARCPSMGGSWEVGKSLLTAGHHTAALAAFQSLLRDLQRSSGADASPADTSPPSHRSPVGMAKAASLELGVPQVLKTWLLRAVAGAANTRVRQRCAAFFDDVPGISSAGAVSNELEDLVLGHNVLLSDATSAALLATDDDGHLSSSPVSILVHAQDTGRRLDDELWSTVRAGCAPLPPAVCVHAMLEGIVSGLMAGVLSGGVPHRAGTKTHSDAHETVTDTADVVTPAATGEEAPPFTGKPPHLAEGAYRLAVAAKWLATHIPTALTGPTEVNSSPPDDGFLRQSGLTLLRSTLVLIDLAQAAEDARELTAPTVAPSSTARLCDTQTFNLVESALQAAWETLAEAVRACAYLNLLAPCAHAIVQHQQRGEEDSDKGTSEARRVNRYQHGLFRLIDAVLGGARESPSAERSRPQLSDAYVLSALSAFSPATWSYLAQSGAFAEPTPSSPVTVLSPRARLLLHTARATASSATTDCTSSGLPSAGGANSGALRSTASTKLAVEVEIVDGASAASDLPWRCTWCQSWNSQRATACKRCMALAISLVQCGQCGAFTTTTHTTCVVCQAPLPTVSEASANAQVAPSPASPDAAHFPLRAWTCQGCHTRNSPGHAFYCAACHRLKPELEGPLKATVFTCTCCQTVNPLGMLKPWCYRCGTLAPAASHSTPTQLGPLLWHCAECRALNPWVRAGCEFCDGRRTSSRPGTTTATCASVTFAAAADVTVPWTLTHCPSCHTANPVWRRHGACRACRTPLHTSTEAAALEAHLRTQWKSWQDWALQPAPAASLSSPADVRVVLGGRDDEPHGNLLHTRRGAEDEVSTQWPSSPSRSTASRGPARAVAGSPEATGTRAAASTTAHAVPSTSAPAANGEACLLGWVCWACGSSHVVVNSASPTAALLTCATCHTTHSAEAAVFVSFTRDTTTTASPTRPNWLRTAAYAGAGLDVSPPVDSTATVCLLTSRASPTDAQATNPWWRSGCPHCGATARAIRPSGVCTRCGSCLLQQPSLPGAHGRDAASSGLTVDTARTVAEWRVRLRLLFRDMASAAAEVITLTQGVPAVADGTHPPTSGAWAQTCGGEAHKVSSLQKAQRVLTTGVQAVRLAPRDALPWTVSSCDVHLTATPTAAHREALDASRAVLRALASQSRMESEQAPAAPPHDVMSRQTSIPAWEARRPALCAALDLIDVWNESTDTDELGFDVLRLVCLALRPEQHDHIERDTRWQYLTNTKLTRPALVHGVACARCLARTHSTEEMPCRES